MSPVTVVFSSKGIQYDPVDGGYAMFSPEPCVTARFDGVSPIALKDLFRVFQIAANDMSSNPNLGRGDVEKRVVDRGFGLGVQSVVEIVFPDFVHDGKDDLSGATDELKIKIQRQFFGNNLPSLMI